MNPDAAKHLEPVFPMKEPLTSDSMGMTLRDYFAAKAMPALIAYMYSTDLMSHQIPVEVAAAAYDLADAMLTERAA